MPARVPMEGGSQEFISQTLEQPTSPSEASLETLLAGLPPLQQRGHSRLDVTPAVARAGTAVQSFVREAFYDRGSP